MQVKKWRGAAALVPVALAFTLCGASPSLAAGVPAPSIPVTVQGFLAGYTDAALAQSVSSCVAQVPVPGTVAEAAPSGWQIRVHMQNVSMPRTATEVGVSLLDGTRVVAVKWQRAMTPQISICGTVLNLTRQLWASVANGNMAAYTG